MRTPPIAVVMGLWAAGMMSVAGCGTAGPSRSLREATLPWGEVAQPGDLGMRGVRFTQKQFRLPSGVKLVVERAPTRGMVGVVLTVAAGSGRDPAGKEGLAHYVEHLTYRARTGKLAVDDQLILLGATYNASTNADFTRYYEFAPAAALPALLALAARRLSSPLEGIDDKTALVEREIVGNELRQRNHTGVYGEVLGALQAAVFAADHPYARPTIGTPQSLGRLTLEDARAFTAANYRLSEASLVVIGEFPEDADVSRLVQELPAPFLAEAAPPPPPPFRRLGAQPPPPPGGARVLQAAVGLPEVWLAWPLPSAYGQEGHLVRMVSAPVLESILNELFADDPDVVTIEVVPVHARQATLLACGIRLWSTTRRAEIARVVGEMVQRVWSAPGDKEIAAQKTREARQAMALWARGVDLMRSRAFAQIAYAAEPYTERALARADHLAVIGDATHYTQAIQKMIEARPDAIGAFSLKYLGADRMRRVDVDPLPADARPAPGLVRERPAIDTPLPVEPPRLAEFGPPPVLPPPRELASSRQFTMENGMAVVLVSRPEFPAVTVALGFPGGDTIGDRPGVRNLVRAVYPPERSSLALNAVEVSGHDRADMTIDLVRAGAGNLPTALAILVERLIDVDVLDWEGAFAANEGRSYVLRGDLPHVKATRAVLAALYGQHPYGRLPSSADQRAIDAAAVRRWLATTHQPRNARLVIVGDIDPAVAEKQVRAWFGPWRNEGAPGGGEGVVPPLPAVAPGPAQEKVIVTHRAGVPQTELLIACRVPGATARDEIVGRSLAAVAGGSLGTQLREDAGVTYGVGGAAHRLRGGAMHITLSTTVDTRRLGDVLRLVRARWKQYGEQGIDPAALSQVRWSLNRAEAMSLQTSTALAGRLIESEGDPVEVGQVSRRIAEVAPADLEAAFAMCRATTVISLVGDEAEVNRALAR